MCLLSYHGGREKEGLEFCDIAYVTLRTTNAHQKLKGNPVSTVLLQEALRLIFPLKIYFI